MMRLDEEVESNANIRILDDLVVQLGPSSRQRDTRTHMKLFSCIL